MCLTMDANRTLSQLSYEPKSRYYYTSSAFICKALFAKFLSKIKTIYRQYAAPYRSGVLP